jgi:arginyl-tRNA synthetase
MIEQALKKKIAFKSAEGAIVSNLEKEGLPNTILLRSDGTGLYITSDMGMTVHKFEKYKLDKSVWVVSSQQNLHFKQLFKLLELLGYEWAKDCKHFSFEHVQLPEGKMSSREGRAVMLDEVIEKLIGMAKEEVSKRNPKLPEKEKQKLAEQIGIGALKYAIVRIEPENLITFDWKQMLSFDGNTGPYIQYAHTRCNSILKKTGKGKWKKVYSIKGMKDEEKSLISMLARFHDVVADAAANMKPHYICNYLYDLTTALNNFYEKCPVLKAESAQQKNFRLTLVDATREILKQGMQLVGMEAPERM